MSNIITRDWTQPNVDFRSSLENPQTPLSYPAEWLLDIFNGGRTDAGMRVSELTAFQVTTFLSCVNIISSKISSLPRHVYERSFLTSSGRPVNKIAYDHDYYDLLTLEPNPEMSSNTFLKTFLIHCLAWQNGYAEIQRDKDRYAVGLWPRNPARTRPMRIMEDTTLPPVPWRPYSVHLPAGSMAYLTTDYIDDYGNPNNDSGKQGTARMIPSEDILHVPGLSFDGRIGQSIVWLARQTLGLALAMDKFGSKYFANFARPGGILITPTGLTEPQKENARRSWMEAQGGENANRVAVLPNGFDWKQMTNNPSEAQTTEGKRELRKDICAIFGVPVHMAGGEDRTKATAEQSAQELKEYCLDHWMSAIKQEVKRKLFPHVGMGRTPRNVYFLDFDTHEMLRPTAESREKFYASGRQWSFLCANDIREMEKKNPIEEAWAEQYIMPVNMTLTTTPVNPTFQDGAGNGTVPGKGKDGKTPAPDDVNAMDMSVVRRYFVQSFTTLQTMCPDASTRDLNVFTASFSVALSLLRDHIYSACRPDVYSDAPRNSSETSESSRFLSSYLISMSKRGAEWTEITPELIAAEYNRAVKGIAVSVARELAVMKALADVESFSAAVVDGVESE